MACEEQDRTMGYKRLYLIPDGQTPDPLDDPTQFPDPGSDPYVDIPVIMRISWLSDGSDLYQEQEWTLDNSSTSGRGALDGNGNLVNSHVDKVFSADTTQNVIFTDANGTQYQAQDDNGNWYQIGTVGDWTRFIKIERTDFFPHQTDGSDQYWEYLDGFDNKTGGDVVNQAGDGPGSDTDPPHFSDHLETHIFRYVNPNNSGWWADAEVIDKYSQQRDGSDLFQEVEYTLNNPDAQADPAWTCLNDTANGIDPPYRIDPFQNIVNWGLTPHIIVVMSWVPNLPTGGSGWTSGTPANIDFFGQIYCLSTCSDQSVNQSVVAFASFGPDGDFTGSSGLGTTTVSLGGGWSNDDPNSWSTSNGVPPAKVGTAPYYGGAYGTQPSWTWSQGSPAPGFVPASEIPSFAPWSSYGTNFSGSLVFTGDKPIGGFVHGLGAIWQTPQTLAAECAETTASISTPSVPTIVRNGTPCTPIGALGEGNSFYIIYKIGA